MEGEGEDNETKRENFRQAETKKFVDNEKTKKKLRKGNGIYDIC
jgi:hypothetical protein